jgi:DUF2917 family protein
MKTVSSPASTTYHVQNDRTLSLAGLAGDRVRVLRGRIWLTEESLASDRILDAGDEIALVAGEVAVLQGLGAAVVSVFRPATGRVPAPLAGLGTALTRLGRAGSSLRVRLHLGPDDGLTIAP